MKRHALAPGARWGRFRVDALVASGATGTVYRALDTRDAREIALKILHLRDPARTKHARHALEAWGTLQHPHIVPVLEIAEYGESIAVVLPMLEATRFDALGADVDMRERVRLIAQAARATAAAHRQGVLHRDIKPAHVLVARCEDGRRSAYLIDVGLAGQVPGVGVHGCVIGTPGYVPPERLGEFALVPDVRGDVYGLGATLYRALAGRPPVPGASATEMLARLRHDPPVPLRALMPTLPRALEVIVHKCLAREPRARYADADALADDLDRFLAGAPLAAPEATLTYRCRRFIEKQLAALASLGSF
jgi:eukaryotic-like serine/threonine-protein kinase